MALLRVETLAQRWAVFGGAPLRERLFAHLPRFARWLGLLNPLLSLRERWPVLARWMERGLGIAARRSLPQGAARSFLSATPTEVVGAAEGREIVLLVDTFSNHFDTETAKAALELLAAGGYRIHIARAAAGERPLCCGRTFLSQGVIAEARAEARRTLDALWPFVERGLPVVGLEPSCLLMLRDEYYSLGLGEKVDKIAKAAVLLEEFLAREHDAKRLGLAFKSMPGARAFVHGHCHQKAFGALKALRKVLGLVPELEVEFIESSCCGMAGAFGLETEHYDVSMRMAELALLPKVREADSDTLLIANGISCRHQIRDGAGRDSMHFARVLRMALAA
jgi:Fe-S oxidoreductase